MRGGIAASSAGETGVSRPKMRRTLLRPLRDALAAGAVFGLISTGVVCGPSNASPHTAAAHLGARAPEPLVQKALAADEPAPFVQIATASSAAAPDAVYKRTSERAAWLLFALAFSGLAALNLATLRHLRQVYAAPARRRHNRQYAGKVSRG